MPAAKRDIDLAEVERLAAQGLADDKIALCLGFCPRTLYARKKDFAGFADALARGRARGEQTMTDLLMEIATAKDGDSYRSDDKTRLDAVKFWLERRAKWVKEQKIDMQSSDGSMSPSKIDLGDRSTEELMALTKQAWAAGSGAGNGAEGGEKAGPQGA